MPDGIKVKLSAARSRLRGLAGDTGSAAIEFAVAVPVLLVLLQGLVEVGFSAYQAMQAQNAAEAGALYAAEHGWNAAGIASAVVNATGASGLTATPAPVNFCGCPAAGGAVTTVACTAACVGGAAPGLYVQVSASIPHETILPYPSLPIPAVLTRRAIVRIQ